MPPGKPKTVKELQEEVERLSGTATTWYASYEGLGISYNDTSKKLELAIKTLKRISGMGGVAAIEAGKTLNLINSL